MKAELYKRLFRAIFSEDILSLKKIAITIIQEERKLGHNILADALEKISITEVTVEVENIEELNKILKQIRKVDSVYEVKRKK